MKNQVVIYALVDPRTDSLFYVGSTKNFDSRIKRHIKRHYTSLRLWHVLSELDKAGCGFDFRVLDVVDAERRDSEEYSWIVRCIDMGEPLINRNVPMYSHTHAGRRHKS